MRRLSDQLATARSVINTCASHPAAINVATGQGCQDGNTVDNDETILASSMEYYNGGD